MFGGQLVNEVWLNGNMVWEREHYLITAAIQADVLTSTSYDEYSLVFCLDTKNLLFYMDSRWHIISHDGVNQITTISTQAAALSSTAHSANTVLYAQDTTNLLIYMNERWHIIESSVV